MAAPTAAGVTQSLAPGTTTMELRPAASTQMGATPDGTPGTTLTRSVPTPKPEKLPGARKRTVPRKPKPNGPGGGGSKGPASRGPLVKA